MEENINDWSDGEVLGIDTDGCIVQWDKEARRTYNCGQLPDEFGLDNLTEVELGRITRFS